MAEARHLDRSATGKRTRARKQLASKIGPKAHSARSRANNALSKVIAPKSRHQQSAGTMTLSYAGVAAMAKRTNQPHVISYRVTPDGRAEPVAEPTAETQVADPLTVALSRAYARGKTKAADILKRADMLTAREFAPLIGASHETVNIKRKRHEVLGLEGATRGVRYPLWQVTDAGLPLPGLARLFVVLGEQPWTVYRFLCTSHPELGGKTALDMLKVGQVDTVVSVAKNQVSGVFA